MRFILFSVLLFTAHYTAAQISLPRLVSDGMVLQRDTDTRLWGWAKPGEKVTLTFNEKQYSTVTDKLGKWAIQLPPQKGGGPYSLTLTASNTITIQDVLFGDVWLCSGQSNMELPLQRVRYNYEDVIAKANNPFIRQFEVPDQYNFLQPQADVASGKWLPATPEHILKFSAVGYFFAAALYQTYKVPIGLINASVGGSPAEAWISEGALKSFPAYWQEAQRFKDKSLIEQIEAADRKTQNDWYGLLNSRDEGLKKDWKNAAFDDSDWQQMNLPGYWNAALGNVNGAVWFRKEVMVPKHLAGQSAAILLGRIVDADSVFINSQFIGTTSYQYPPRRYAVPEGLLKEGKNEIVIRVINQSGNGGFILDKPYSIVFGDHSIDLKGIWKFKLGAIMEPLPGQTFVRWKPVGLFNAMIAPIAAYPIKGVLWYQGESNTDRATEYNALMQTLIADWRKHWQQKNLPFLFVQLPNFGAPQTVPAESNWARLRQSQLELLSIQNTGMAVAIDVGEWNDIHPLNKKDVGTRLALQAKKVAYGAKNLIASGPLYQSVRKEGNKLIISFTNTGSGLLAKDGAPLKHFAIAGKDKNFVWAKAQIKGYKIIVWSDTINEPVAVRYAWADNPEGANLFNKAHLPAVPFEAMVK